MQIISGRTKICGVIGDPIEHSMSPVMLTAAFRDKGVDYVDIPFRVRKEELGNAIKGMRALNIRGLNVTIPHKVSVIQFLDEIDSVASKIGAVNTIVNDDGILKGYNTDATGFLQALRERGVEPKGKRVVVLGAGGAARAISFILAESGSGVVILNRTLERAKVCADRVAQSSRKKVIALKLDRENLASALSNADLLVNTTSVGMSPKINETPVTADLLKPNLVVCDIVYNPLKTRLLREAEMVGATVVDGVDMFVWQGALAFEKWTGLSAPIALMKREVIKVLERDEN